jgi:UDP-hydrolysing UDP-N-acetyl-D-glucosamine 2-epimerase
MRQSDIAVVTTGRADYGLLHPLIEELRETAGFNPVLIATGSHLSPLHGLTVRLIEQEVSHAVEMSPDEDTEAGICRAMARGLSGFSGIFGSRRPDLLMVLGDRYELWPACMAATVHRIPIAHLHGGESTRGAIDEAVRHSITKMAALHFPAAESYGRRIVQMGENPRRVHVVGALGIDNIARMELMNAGELSGHTGLDFERGEIALLTYHPVTLDDPGAAERQIRDILDTLLDTRLSVLMTMPNADAGGSSIYRVMESYAGARPDRFRIVKNLGQRGYLSAMRHARLMIGNSSSGIIESASFRLPVVNIGDRQGGRLKPANVIDCPCSREAMAAALARAGSEEFGRSLAGLENPYGDGNAARRIVRILGGVDLSDSADLLKKDFYDLDLVYRELR